jgi:hypothetical protein
MRVVIIAILFGFISINAYSLGVQSIKCGLDVKNRAIVNEAENFKVGDRVYCLSVIKDVKKNDEYVINRWISDEVKYDIKLSVKPSVMYRTWSYKTVHHAGVWKMEVLDKEGNLLKEKIFVVK